MRNPDIGHRAGGQRIVPGASAAGWARSVLTQEVMS